MGDDDICIFQMSLWLPYFDTFGWMSGRTLFPCTIKSRSSLLAPAHPGGPGKRAVKRLWCGVIVVSGRTSSCKILVGPVLLTVTVLHTSIKSVLILLGSVIVCQYCLGIWSWYIISRMGNEYWPQCNDALHLKSEGRYGSLHSFVDKRMGGSKTVWSSLARAIPESLRGEYRIKSVVQICKLLFYPLGNLQNLVKL